MAYECATSSPSSFWSILSVVACNVSHDVFPGETLGTCSSDFAQRDDIVFSLSMRMEDKITRDQRYPEVYARSIVRASILHPDSQLLHQTVAICL